MHQKQKHFLSISDNTKLEEINKILDLIFFIDSLKKNYSAISHLLQQKTLISMFFEPSTRTRLTFNLAFNLLGGIVQDITTKESCAIAKGESVVDSSKVISNYCDIVVIRTNEKDFIEIFAENSDTPVINAGNASLEHPSQALIDLYTVFKEYCSNNIKNISTLAVCFFGDLKHARTIHSFAKLLSLYQNINFYLVSMPELSMPQDILNFIKKNNNKIIQTQSLEEGVKYADVIYTSRLQTERHTNNKFNNNYSINSKFYTDNCQKNAIVMHPMPRNFNVKTAEINDDFLNNKNLKMFSQVANAIPSRMALFLNILGFTKEKLL